RHTRLVSDWSSDVCSSDLLLEVISRVEKKHGNSRKTLAQQIKHDHVFRLKAARDADGILFRGSDVLRDQTVDYGVRGKCLEFFSEHRACHCFPARGSEYVLRHLRNTFMIRSTASSSVSSVMRTAKKPSGPN